MLDEKDFDRIRGAALERIARARRIFWWLIAATAVLEGAMLVVVFLLADVDDPVHRLILACSFLIYWTLAMCMLALGGFINLLVQRVLKAIACQALPPH